MKENVISHNLQQLLVTHKNLKHKNAFYYNNICFVNYV